MRRDWFEAENPEAEWQKSWREGRSSRVWPIAERYELDGDLIRPSPNMRYLYWPMARSRLPLELAKVKDGDQAAALLFVRNWGLLGYNRLAAPENRLDGEPVSFIWAKAKDVKRLLLKILPVLLSEPDRDPEQEEQDLREIQVSLSQRLEGIHPALELQEVAGQLDAPRFRLRRAFDFDALIQVVYWHIWNFIEGPYPLVNCQECGELFLQEDSRQRFCPPSEKEIQDVRAGMRTRAQSKCGLRHRQDKLRNPKGEGHEQAR